MADAAKPRRDALGNSCFVLHLAILAFIVMGWAIPWRGALIGYLVFLPAMILHWWLNQDACVLNNLESWLRYRRWRVPEKNPEEGAWLRTLVRAVSGIALSKGRMDLVMYATMALLWALAWRHFLQFQGS